MDKDAIADQVCKRDKDLSADQGFGHYCKVMNASYILEKLVKASSESRQIPRRAHQSCIEMMEFDDEMSRADKEEETVSKCNECVDFLVSTLAFDKHE